MLAIGETAPNFRAQPVFGLPVDVEANTSRYPLVICFVSGLGNPLTRQTFADLAEKFAEFDVVGIQVAVVTRSGLDVARDYVPRHHVLFPVVSDPSGDLYTQYQVGGQDWKSAVKALDPRSVRRAMRSMKLGVGKPERGTMHLPAEFVVAPGGGIAYVRYGTAVNDILNVDTLLTAAKEALA
jgi:peroxiredoxin